MKFKVINNITISLYKLLVINSQAGVMFRLVVNLFRVLTPLSTTYIMLDSCM